MMQVMKDGPIVVHKPEWIPGKHITAMITNRLDSRKRAKEHTLPRRELC